MSNVRPIEDRDYQIRIIQKTYDSYAVEKLRSVVIESPTGSGKTVMGLSVCKRMSELHRGIRFNWVAMRRKLLQQAEEENDRIKVPGIRFVSMFDRDAPECDFMVTDEAQHDSARTCTELHNTTGSRWALGLTATPFRTDRIKLPYERVINDCGVRFLVEQGWLSQFRQFVIPKWDPETVAARFLAEPDRWGKSVFFFTERQYCEEFHNRIKDRVKAAVIFGTTSQEEQEEIHERFESGDLQALTNIHMLTEGFDCPSLRTVWVRDSGKLCTMQMAGRVLRKDPNDPTKVANIMQSEETSYPYTKVTKCQEQYVWRENSWRSILPSELVEQLSSTVRDIIHPTPVELPSYLTGGPRKITITKDGKFNLSQTNRQKRRSTGFAGAPDSAEGA